MTGALLDLMVGEIGMGIKTQWDNEARTVLRWVFEPPWTWEDYAAAQDESNGMLQGLDYKVDVIGDISASAGLPANALTAYRSLVGRTAPNIDLIVLVGANIFIRGMVGIFMKLVPRATPGANFAFAPTLEEARRIIQTHQEKRQGDAPSPKT